MSEQAELVFTKQQESSDFRQPQCCARPTVSSLDYTVFHADRMTEERLNRVCLKCGAHWYGPPSNVREYTHAEWDELMESALHEEVMIAQPRYAAYCIENRRTPAEQLAHDEAEYPGGKMAGFMVWSSQQGGKGAAA